MSEANKRYREQGKSEGMSRWDFLSMITENDGDVEITLEKGYTIPYEVRIQAWKRDLDDMAKASAGKCRTWLYLVDGGKGSHQFLFEKNVAGVKKTMQFEATCHKIAHHRIISLQIEDIHWDLPVNDPKRWKVFSIVNYKNIPDGGDENDYEDDGKEGESESSIAEVNQAFNGKSKAEEKSNVKKPRAVDPVEKNKANEGSEGNDHLLTREELESEALKMAMNMPSIKARALKLLNDRYAHKLSLVISESKVAIEKKLTDEWRAKMQDDEGEYYQMQKRLVDKKIREEIIENEGDELKKAARKRIIAEFQEQERVTSFKKQMTIDPSLDADFSEIPGLAESLHQTFDKQFETV